MDKIQINIPEGFEIDQNKSDLSKGIIEFKPVEKKKLSYEDVAESLFRDKNHFYIDKFNEASLTNGIGYWADPFHANSKEQLECLMAYNKLRNVAEYLNGRWKPDGYIITDPKYFFSVMNDMLGITGIYTIQTGAVCFVTKQLAEKAIEILGEEEIKKALFIY